ncbi:MAG: flavodoxin-dependent (E)-4-hydroxy-3-methylbut-2-enyl-diphosphate synthase [Candidatus Omnitrophota bacterium]
MTRQIKVGKVKIGGGAPVSVQSMVKTETTKVQSVIKEIKALEDVGCEIVRLAVKDNKGASCLKKIKSSVNIPIVADIHYDYRLALLAIENGVDKIRLNPGNIYKKEHVFEVARHAKKNRIPIRVGVNSGSLKTQDTRHKTQDTRHKSQDTSHKSQVDIMVKSALDYIKLLEKAGFYDIIVSLKASDVLMTIDAYRKFSKASDYPLHLGVTAAGPKSSGLVKSSIGIGVLLLEGIGDTIRVSLTGNSSSEVMAAQNILQAINLRRFYPEIISCPTCGRCQVDLSQIVAKVEERITDYGLRVTGKKNPKIAIMGCEVNGPGEAKEADFGIAFGKGAGVLFKKGKIIKRIEEKDTIKTLLRYLG